MQAEDGHSSSSPDEEMSLAIILDGGHAPLVSPASLPDVTLLRAAMTFVALHDYCYMYFKF